MAYDTLQEEGAPVPQRSILNFLGTWGFVADDVPGDRSAYASGYDPLGVLRAALSTVTPHLQFTGNLHLLGNAGISALPDPADFLRSGNPSTGSDGVIAVQACVGSYKGIGPGEINGVGGYCFATVAPTAYAYGLDYQSGSLGRPLPAAAAVRAQIAAAGAGAVLTNGMTFHAKAPFKIGATITTAYHLYLEAISTAYATNRRPIYEQGSGAPGDSHGNRIYSNTQFGSLAGAFAGGDGLIGLANARVLPTAVPAGGGVLYSVAGALYLKGQLGTVTLIAPP